MFPRCIRFVCTKVCFLTFPPSLFSSRFLASYCNILIDSSTAHTCLNSQGTIDQSRLAGYPCCLFLLPYYLNRDLNPVSVLKFPLFTLVPAAYGLIVASNYNFANCSMVGKSLNKDLRRNHGYTRTEAENTLMLLLVFNLTHKFLCKNSIVKS